MAGEYEDIVKRIPVPEKAIGPLTGLATRLDYIGPQVADLAEKVGKLDYVLRTLELPAGVAIPGLRVEQIPFTYNLAALQGVLLMEKAPFSGYIKQVTPHWPDGCAALVDIRLGHGTKQFCPKAPKFLALNDATPTYPFNEWVNESEEIWVEIENHDGAESHNITVTLIISGVES